MIYTVVGDPVTTYITSGIFYSMWSQAFCVSFVLVFKAGEDEADDPLQSDHMLTPPVLWCNPLYPNEWEEADLGVSSLWQEGTIWAPHYWWVSTALHLLICTYNEWNKLHVFVNL